MEPNIMRFAKPVTLLGGGEVTSRTVDTALRHAPNLVAADGGASLALQMGQIPAAVFGDFDSLDKDAQARIPADRLHRIDEQDSTDFDKALRHIAAPLVLGVGFMGQRLDHELAAYNSLVRHSDRRCILLGEHDLCFLAPTALDLRLPRGTRFSLFPLAPCTANATGLRWPVEALELAPDGRVGTSNEVVADRVALRVSAPKLLVILPREHLEQAMTALGSAPSRAG